MEKIFDSELKVMEILWKEGDLSASDLAKILNKEIGWNRNTTYTVIKKLIEKGAISRYEPNFMCKSLITKNEIQKKETKKIIEKLFDNSTELFLSTFFKNEMLTKEQIDHLKKLVEELK